MTTRSHILIATPVLNDSVTLVYTKSLFALQNHVRRNDLPIDMTLGTLTSTFVDAARNYFATHMLENRAYSHLLFVDSDQGFRPELVTDMLALDEPVVGTVYPARDLDFDHLWRVARQLEAPTKLQSLASRYVLPPFVRDASGAVIAKKGFVRTTLAGTGVMLIQRRVFERMAELPGIMGQGAEIMQRHGYSGRLLQCFRPIIQDNNLPLGEDLSFCRRWVEACGGEIWVSVDHEVQHVGSFNFRGRFGDQMA
jgi:hypothetical protein